MKHKTIYHKMTVKKENFLLFRDKTNLTIPLSILLEDDRVISMYNRIEAEYLELLRNDF